MNKLLLALTTLFMPLFLKAQVHENFSDDAVLNSSWFGDSSFFINASKQLQSKSQVSGEIAYLTQNILFSNIEWDCWIRNAFSPSTQNFSRFYLMSDSSNLKSSLNGYYVQFGGVTGNLDSISLWKQKGNTKSCLIGGRAGTFNKSNNVVRIKVKRDNIGNWLLWSDTTGGYHFELEGAAFDDEFIQSHFLGYYAKLTSGNGSNIFLDDVYVGPIIHDSVPPYIDTAFVISDSIIELDFSEQVDSVSILNISNYFVDNGLGFPREILVLENDPTKVKLLFQQKLNNKNTYNIAIVNLADLAGNQSIDLQISLTYYVPQKFDLLISEFLPDPSPTNDLPESEFVELYNNTNIPIQLFGWKLTDGSTSAVFPDITINPYDYLIVCNLQSQNEYSLFGKSIGLSAFPSLNNSGDHIQIWDAKNQLIHEVQYNYSWYNDASKSGGGWSIELINPTTICKNKFDYTVSIDSAGGTPGKVNSVWDTHPDKIGPQLVETITLDSSLFYCLFNEPIDSFMALNAVIQIKSPSIFINSHIQKVNVDSLLISHQPFEPNRSFQFTIKEIGDCLLNKNDNVQGEISYFVPEAASFSDIVINEIMANPQEGRGLPNSEYIELVNTSKKVISLNGWQLTDNSSTAFISNYILLPDSFILIVPISSIPLFPNAKNLVGLKSFPSLGNDGDELFLIDSNGKLMHSIKYNKLTYQNAIKQLGGFSLELIDAKKGCLQQNNWIASSSPLGGTPGMINSVIGVLDIMPKTNLIHIYPTSKNELLLYFSTNLAEPDHITQIVITPTISCDVYGLANKDKSILKLILRDSMINHQVYSLNISNQPNCLHQSIETQQGEFGWPEDQVNPRIVINELLFHPKVNGADFVELINISDSIYDLKNIALANQNYQDSLSDYQVICSEGRLFFPNQYIAITESINKTIQQYDVINKPQLIESILANYNNTEGSCVLINSKTFEEIDHFNYSEKMHFQLIEDKSGVSLERVNYLRPTNDLTNWTSASSRNRYATPTYQNSQFLKSINKQELFQIYPDKISPDEDGYEDMMNFSYQLNAPNFIGNIELYSDQGLLIKRVLHAQLVGTEGTVSWDGLDELGKKAPLGIYIAYFNFFDNKGNVLTEKKSFVVAAKL